MNTTMRLVSAVTVVAAALFFDAPASRAYYGDGPWCAVASMGNGNAVWDCQYRTVEECAPVITGGNRGFCNPSPWYVPNTVALRKHRTVHSRRN